MSVRIGVDVGGTKIAAGAVGDDGEVLAFLRKPTPASDPSAVAGVIAECVRELARSYDVRGVGIGAAGFVDDTRTTIVFAPNLAWRNEPLALRVADATGLPVVVENDANAAAWGEFRFGVAAGYSSVVVVTVGTGIGGGIIVDGRLLRGSGGFAGEIGHINVVPGGLRCGCGLAGCWEAYSSGTALVRFARALAGERPRAAARMLELAGGGDIAGLHVTQAAREGDPAALECFAHISHWLGVGLADLSAVLDPEAYVLAGGVSEAGELLAAPTRTSLEESLTARTFRPMPPVMVATLGSNAGIAGAADLAGTD